MQISENKVIGAILLQVGATNSIKVATVRTAKVSPPCPRAPVFE